MKPKGILFMIGGAESEGGTEHEFLDAGGKNKEFQRYEILKEILKKSKKRKIEIITTASNIQDEVKRHYEDSFREIDFPHPDFLEIKERRDCEREEYIERINKASAVFFTGGDQKKLAEILHGTPIEAAIKQQYFLKKDFLVAGTSAGAMAMSTIMISGGGREEALFNKDLDIEEGIGLIDNCIIDTHFIKRGRFSRLAHAVIKNREKLGIGLGEDTALVVKGGHLAYCRGSGMVVIIDGKKIKETNIDLVSETNPIYVENLKVHLLVKGCVFNLKTRRLYKAKLPKLT